MARAPVLQLFLFLSVSRAAAFASAACAPHLHFLPLCRVLGMEGWANWQAELVLWAHSGYRHARCLLAASAKAGAFLRRVKIKLEI